MNHAFLPAAVIAAVLLATTPSAAQFSDEFSDSFHAGPPFWLGDTAHFMVNAAQQLQLQAPDAGVSSLWTATTVPDSARWEMDIRLDFAPSASNRLRIYLQADQTDLAAARGYGLEIGENGTADAIRLFRQDGPGVPVAVVLTGTPGLVAGEPVSLRLRVERTAGGRWALWAGPPSGPATLEGLAIDSTYTGSDTLQYVALQCVYSASRRDKFYFDNIFLTRIQKDTHPPTPLFVEAVSLNAVTVVFSEPVDSASAVQPGHYTISSVGAPDSVGFNRSMPDRVTLRLPIPLANGAVHILTVEGVGDTTGNTTLAQQLDFLVQVPEVLQALDLVFTEIMFDPTPSAGLPEVEWLEVQNISTKLIDLGGLRVLAGTDTTDVLPAALLGPGDRIVLTSVDGATALAGLAGATVLGIADFPGLNNAGELLALLQANGTAIDRVDYRPDWHTDEAKAAGGWSLERRMPVQPCAGASGWQSCPHPSGGTPGQANAAPPLPPDHTPPALRSVAPIAPDTLRLTFAEGLAGPDSAGASWFSIEPPVLIAAVQAEPGSPAVTVVLAEALSPGVLYAIWPTPFVRDCAGNPATADTLYCGLPQPPLPLDLVINELLFNPASGGARYVELYNRSAKLLITNGLYWRSGSGTVAALPSHILLPPGSYATFTTDTADIARRFPDVQDRWLFEQPLLPLADDGGAVSLYYVKNAVAQTIDSMPYEPAWHNPLLSAAEREGVALERLSVEAPAVDPANWTSAVPRGTPTRPNSQRVQPSAASVQDSFLWLSVPRLSPDGDGREDFLEIQYRVPGPDYSATVVVYDAAGTVVRQLHGARRIGSAGFWRWHGERTDGSPAPPGLYVLYAEFMHPAGTVERVAKPLALVKNLY